MSDDVAPAPESPPEPAPEPAVAPAEVVPEPISEPVVQAVTVEAEVPQATEPPAAVEAIPEAAPTEAPPIVSSSAPASSQSQPTLTPTPSLHWNKVDPTRARAGRTRRVKGHLEKIVTFARTRPYITNDDIEKLLHVSDATAGRYLKMLVARGLMVKEGKTRAIRYKIVR